MWGGGCEVGDAAVRQYGADVVKEFVREGNWMVLGAFFLGCYILEVCLELPDGCTTGVLVCVCYLLTL